MVTFALICAAVVLVLALIGIAKMMSEDAISFLLFWNAFSFVCELFIKVLLEIAKQNE